ncbi:MAG: extracellular catalytic domain type 1 short-chain-length polyhydroxyalkanoate depolymerase [Thermoguttaceae bacterium]
MPYLLLSLALLTAEPLATGDHVRKLTLEGRERSYIVHVPPRLEAQQLVPVVLAFHGAGTNAPIMALSTGLSAKADQAGFVVVYPNGTGKDDFFLVWNSGGFAGPGADRRPDDVALVLAVLDDLATVIQVDPKRVYATGMSNGGMMCYRLAAELSDRIAAIAPVSGTMAVQEARPGRPVAVIHFHGTADQLVPFEGPSERTARFLKFMSVADTIRAWVKLDGCPAEPSVSQVPDKAADDGCAVTREVYGPGKEGTEVILYTIAGGGHTWPGRQWPIPWLGPTTRDIVANDLIWEFFEKHPMK